MILQLFFIALSLTLSVLFFMYGFNHYYLLAAARRYHSPTLPASSGFRPSVCVHLPIYNERYVVRRLAAACTRMAEAYGMKPTALPLILVVLFSSLGVPYSAR